MGTFCCHSPVLLGVVDYGAHLQLPVDLRPPKLLQLHLLQEAKQGSDPQPGLERCLWETQSCLHCTPQPCLRLPKLLGAASPSARAGRMLQGEPGHEHRYRTPGNPWSSSTGTPGQGSAVQARLQSPPLPPISYFSEVSRLKAPKLSAPPGLLMHSNGAECLTPLEFGG